jgi:hypothetical protein
MVVHAVASYNTSWMGDSGNIVPFASEKHLFTNQKSFQVSSEINYQTDKREYFLNAISNALHFWRNIPVSSAISFQEMNDQDFVRQTDPSFPGGFQFITRAFADNTPSGDLESANFCVQSGPARPCLLTLWKKSKLGHKLFEYGEDIVYDVNGNKQTGRPILIVLTSKNYYLINLHSPNHGSESDSGMPKLRDAINQNLAAARSKFGSGISPFDPKKVIIMGDFNDPYHGINASNKLKIAGHQYTFGDVRAPNSCCYNFNSSCEGSIYGMLDAQQQQDLAHVLKYDPSQGDKLDMKPKECAIVHNDTVPSRDMRVGAKSQPRSLETRGELINYKFTGDYCFTYAGNTIVQPLSIYRSVTYPDGVSHESDHEMVMLIFDDGFKGGANQRRVSKANKNQNKRRSRKY